jgi:hypothetical protein
MQRAPAVLASGGGGEAMSGAASSERPADERSDGARPAGQRRRWLIAAAIYLAVTVLFVAMMAPERRSGHTPYNHYALQAEAWLAGRLDLGGPPPAYTHRNDFAVVGDKTFVSFPPLPAVLLLPAVALAGGAEAVPDGLWFVLLSGLGPALLFLVLSALARSGRIAGGEREHVGLAAAFALGTVYWFSALQGTVWFAGHVVSVALLCGYLLASVEARHPALAGAALALAVATRPTMAFALPWFAHELWCRAQQLDDRRERMDLLSAGLMRFALPLSLVALLLMGHNHARFGDPLEFGHRHLAVRWRPRIERWGLFSTHYLGRNLAVMLTALPFWSPERGLQVNGHGLALWITSPFYLWALWPARATRRFWAAALCAVAVAGPNLLYQNTGWLQFGYRFSNDFAPLLLLMIALGRRPLRRAFWGCVALAVLVNAVGAVTFDRAPHRSFYFVDPSQRIVHQPD